MSGQRLKRARRHYARPRRASAFTLIELLAVIAIIGVLAAILIPVVGSARQSARQAENVAKLRTLGMACSLYANDNRGRMPVAVIHSTNGNQNTEAHRLWSNRQDLLRILGDGFIAPSLPRGAGAACVPNADVFYGPFTPRLNEGREPGRLKPAEGSASSYDISYRFYSLHSTNPAVEPGLFNDYNNRGWLTTTPLLSDPTTTERMEEFGWTGKRISVVRLDGSVKTFEAARLTPESSAHARIRILAGLR